MSMPTLPRTDEGKRICQVIRVKPEALEEYKRVSPAKTWRGQGKRKQTELVLLASNASQTHLARVIKDSLAYQVHAAVWPEVLAALRKAHVVGKP